ncbi:phosphatase 2C-like domain-containing protein [Peziza echinospora]|nr:phosphatase 2C-like domain-containing protein [Peziza echinospora]
MFGNSSSTPQEKSESPAPPASPTDTKHHRSSSGKASSLLASARNSLSSFGTSIGGGSPSTKENESKPAPSSKTEPKAAAAPPASPNNNNSAGDSKPGPNSSFRVGVTEDRNKKCRRTMEDTHAYLYNFLSSPTDSGSSEASPPEETAAAAETDNGYFAIFDGHAGTYAADWCGKRLHLVLEDTIKKNPHTPIPELLDLTFTSCDGQLEKLPMRNSGCTAVCAVLRWEDRVANGSSPNANAAAASDPKSPASAAPPAEKSDRQQVLYTANVGDARIVLCRGGKALRLSYDHKGSDENESKRVSNAGGLILNNRVNGVLAVTRALGDSYMKDLVTGHPYTTETVIQPEDEFIILACDGLWDVCSDQEAVDLVRAEDDPQQASKMLVDHALQRFSSDNLSCMIVRLDQNKGSSGEAPKDAATPPQPGQAGKAQESPKTTAEVALIKEVPAVVTPQPETTTLPQSPAQK